MIVMKFGGTSVKTAPAIKKVLQIVKPVVPSHPLLVLSACGGITDKLAQLPALAAENNKSAVDFILQQISGHHTDLVNELITDRSSRNSARRKINALLGELKELLEGITLLGEHTEKTSRQCVAYGELFSTNIFYYYSLSQNISSLLLDARDLITVQKNQNNVFTENNFNKKYISKIRRTFAAGKLVITQGFIASDEQKQTTNLGRGGSDYTAAIIGAALQAKEIQIWSDVDGVLTADPRIVKNAKLVERLSFTDMELMAFFGAKVLHPRAVKPAIKNSIPVKMLNTFNTKSRGTLITGSAAGNKRNFKSLVSTSPARIIEIATENNIHANKVQSDIISALDKYGYHIYSSKRIENKIFIISNKREHFDEILLAKLPGLRIKNNIGLLLIAGLKDIAGLLNIISRYNIEYYDINYMAGYSSAVLAVAETKLREYLTLLHDNL